MEIQPLGGFRVSGELGLHKTHISGGSGGQLQRATVECPGKEAALQALIFRPYEERDMKEGQGVLE